jgi:hypothetical protein
VSNCWTRRLRPAPTDARMANSRALTVLEGRRPAATARAEHIASDGGRWGQIAPLSDVFVLLRRAAFPMAVKMAEYLPVEDRPQSSPAPQPSLLGD